MTDFEPLANRIRRFALERGWEQFHNPKNLAMAVASEAGELLAELRWLTNEEARPEALSVSQREAIGYEMADVLIFLIRMADVLAIDLSVVGGEKMDINESRFDIANG